MKKKLLAIVLMIAMVFAFTACGSKEAEESEPAETAETVTVNVFAAASLSAVMADFEASYEAANEGVDIVINADSSGALLTQIQEGAPCDVFFSAAQKQMDTLWSEYKRLSNPHIYKVDLSDRLYELKKELLRSTHK